MKFLLDLLTRVRSLPLPQKTALALPLVVTVLVILWILHAGPFERDLAKTLTLVGILLFFLILFLLIRFLRKRSERKEGDKLNKEVIDSVKDARGASVEQAEYEIQFENRLKEHIALLKQKDIDFYTIPWYVIIGEPASGKTTMMKSSALSFDEKNLEGVKGTGGTLFVDWFLTMEGVILDTAGRLTVSEAEANLDQWIRFLKMLRRVRPHCPINGVIVVVPCDSMLSDDRNKREENAEKIRQALFEIQRNLEIQFPVWLVATKSDLVLGFTEFANLFGVDQQRQMLGWSKPGSFQQPWSNEEFENGFSSVLGRVENWRSKFLSRTDLTVRELELINLFPTQFERLHEPLSQYIQDMLTTGLLGDPLFFRGFYFTSGVQLGRPIPAGSHTRLGESGLLDHLEDLFPDSKAFFIRDFFREKVFQEQGLVVRPKRAEMQDRRARRWARIASAGVAVAACLLIGWGYWLYKKQSGYRGLMEKQLTGVQDKDLRGEFNGKKISEIFQNPTGEELDPNDVVVERLIRDDLKSAKNKWRGTRVLLSGLGKSSHREAFQKVHALYVRDRILRPVLQKAIRSLETTNVDQILAMPPGAERDAKVNDLEDQFQAVLGCYCAGRGTDPRGPEKEDFAHLLKLQEGSWSGLADAFDEVQALSKADRLAVWGAERYDLPLWGIFDRDYDGKLIRLANRVAEYRSESAVAWWSDLKEIAKECSDTLDNSDLQDGAEMSLAGLQEAQGMLLDGLEKVANHLRTFVRPDGNYSPEGSKKKCESLYQRWMDKAAGTTLVDRFQAGLKTSADQLGNRIVDQKKAMEEYAFLVSVVDATPTLTPAAAAFRKCLGENFKQENIFPPEKTTRYDCAREIGRRENWDDPRPELDVCLNTILSEKKRTSLLCKELESDEGYLSRSPWIDWKDILQNADEELMDAAWRLWAAKCAWDSGVKRWAEEQLGARQSEIERRMEEGYYMDVLTTLGDFHEWIGEGNFDRRYEEEEVRDPFLVEFDRVRVAIAKLYYDDWKSQVDRAKREIRQAVDDALGKIDWEGKARAISDVHRLKLPKWERLPKEFEEGWIPASDFYDEESFKIPREQLVGGMERVALDAECIDKLRTERHLEIFAEDIRNNKRVRFAHRIQGGARCEEVYRELIPEEPTRREAVGIELVREKYSAMHPSKDASTKTWMKCEHLEEINRVVEKQTAEITLGQRNFYQAVQEWRELLCAEKNVTVEMELARASALPYAFFYFLEEASNRRAPVYLQEETGGGSKSWNWPAKRLAEGQWALEITEQPVPLEDQPALMLRGDNGVLGLLAELRSFSDPTWMITPSEDGGWDVQREGRKKVLSIRILVDGKPVEAGKLEELDWSVWRS